MFDTLVVVGGLFIVGYVLWLICRKPKPNAKPTTAYRPRSDKRSTSEAIQVPVRQKSAEELAREEEEAAREARWAAAQEDYERQCAEQGICAACGGTGRGTIDMDCAGCNGSGRDDREQRD